MHRVSIVADDVVYQEGETSDLAYLLLSGEVAMEHKGMQLKTTTGAVIGLSALVERPYGATARAVGRCDLLAFTRRELRGMIRSDPDRALPIIDGIIDLVGMINAATDRPGD